MILHARLKCAASVIQVRLCHAVCVACGHSEVFFVVHPLGERHLAIEWLHQDTELQKKEPKSLCIRQITIPVSDILGAFIF